MGPNLVWQQGGTWPDKHPATRPATVQEIELMNHIKILNNHRADLQQKLNEARAQLDRRGQSE